jgi:hypothetical protein
MTQGRQAEMFSELWPYFFQNHGPHIDVVALCLHLLDDQAMIMAMFDMQLRRACIQVLAPIGICLRSASKLDTHRPKSHRRYVCFHMLIALFRIFYCKLAPT